MNLNKHKYQIEYENTEGLFWDDKPAKYVKEFIQLESNLKGKKVLDLGAGEGKNAVFLANLGLDVVAVDISQIALNKFTLQPNYELAAGNIIRVNQNIINLEYSNGFFDIIVAYGILHCMSSKEEIQNVILRMKEWTKLGGYNIITTFTDEIPPPMFQDYLEYEAFLPKGELQYLYSDWQIIKTEDEIINEIHPTSNVSHQHSLTRLIAQKHV